ncbi:signal transduction histidine kinase [Crossiella equi]|uniref:histidine kinase n=1 Tax=Crossiella equi TaxID=130796 RepID=A0ABS5A6J9_9PSEU|nr:histidine kinase [Crossiella equi]MBP2471857.1 signal transduction histidine kinase [Crossiella equi]
MREIRKQWPAAGLLAVLLGAQLYLVWPANGRQLVMFGVVTLACLAAVCAHRHLLATAVLCAAVLAGTALTSGLGRAVFLPVQGVNGPAGFDLGPGPLSFPETAAVLALVMLVVRTARPAVSVGVLVALALVAAHAARLRPALGWLEYENSATIVRSHLVWYERESFVVLVLLGVAATAIGLLLRSGDAHRALVAAAAVARAQRDERFELARELHDVVAHHVTGMLVLAQAAKVLAEDNTKAACDLLPRIITGGTEAVGAMRHLVGTLRESTPTAPAGTLAAELTALVAEAREAGLPVRAGIDVPGEVGQDLRHTVLRVVREALTNTRKHAADATRVEVDVQLSPTAIRLSVSDNGSAQPAHSGGYGLVGMRERVELLGGRLFTGATGSGWLVAAELPLEVAT